MQKNIRQKESNRVSTPTIFFQDDDDEDAHYEDKNPSLPFTNPNPEITHQTPQPVKHTQQHPIGNQIANSFCNDESEDNKSELQRQLSLQEKIKKRFEDFRSSKEFLYRPTEKGKKITMCLSRNKIFMGSQFICRVQFQQREVIMATQKVMAMNRLKYEVSMQKDFLHDIEKEPFFLGLMIKEDGNYQITDDGSFKVHKTEKIARRVGAININHPLFFDRVVKMLTPKIENGEMAIIEANQISKLFAIEERKVRITELNTYKNIEIDERQAQQMNKMMGCRKSKNSLVVKSQEAESNAMILGRVNDVEFKIDLLQELSPFQAFCLCVAWLD